ncbi:MAG: isochorismatase family protein [Actinobacteria bacterium]|nr:MAG: isochorismatase family protein [Actinomycetota bacterium]
MPRRAEVVAAAVRLARVAALVGAPLIVTRQYPEGLGGTVPEVESALTTLAASGARVQGVDKTAFCCAAEGEFVQALQAVGRRQVVICGMETHICVAQTALALAGDGHEVQVVADGCCSLADLDHDVALDRMRGAGIVVTTSQAVMYEAVGRAATDEFKALLKIVKGEA